MTLIGFVSPVNLTIIIPRSILFMRKEVKSTKNQNSDAKNTECVERFGLANRLKAVTLYRK